MLFRLSSVALVFCAATFPQSTPVSAELVRAREEFRRVEKLVSEGVLPRASLSRAETALADAEDHEILSQAFHGATGIEDLDEKDAVDMIGAATRRLERQREALAAARKLADAGALSQAALSPYVEELDRRSRALDEAHSRARLVRELIEMARAEESAEIEEKTAVPQGPRPAAERFDGKGLFQVTDLKTISLAFLKQFGRVLPVTAVGSTAVHRRLGFDHRGRVDVGLDPDDEQGAWLRRHLESRAIPYFVFRQALRGRSTAPHIHIGPPSPRLTAGD